VDQNGAVREHCRKLISRTRSWYCVTEMNVESCGFYRRIVVAPGTLVFGTNFIWQFLGEHNTAVFSAL